MRLFTSLTLLVTSTLAATAAVAQTPPPAGKPAFPAAPGAAPPPPAAPPPAAQPAPAPAFAPPAAAQPPPMAPPAAPPPAAPPPAAPPPADAEEEQQVHFEFFDPPQAFKLPPPPPAPSPSVLLSAFFRAYGFFGGRMSGAASHVGATVGGDGTGFMLGYMPGSKLFTVGVEVPRFRGKILSQNGTLRLGLLGPAFEGHAVTDFGDNLFLTAGASLIGVNLSSCSLGGSGLAYFIQARGHANAWVPVKVGGKSPDDHDAIPFASVGLGLEAGLVFF